MHNGKDYVNPNSVNIVDIALTYRGLVPSSGTTGSVLWPVSGPSPVNWVPLICVFYFEKIPVFSSWHGKIAGTLC